MKYTRQITFKLTEEQYAKLETFIGKLNVPTVVGAVLRMLIDNMKITETKNAKK